MGALDNPHDLDLPPSRIPRVVQWAGMILFVVGVVVASVFAATEHWRRATFVLGASMLWLALLRLTCDSRVLGVFAVRSRRFDAFFCLLIGGTMAFLSASVDALGS
ncbi:DUF3017 domain-containing protein [Corynebacterium testudinoris]|uniref:Putative DUF3017 family protein n=1 Tax=Corynebacterium testudinoris TaxID=136857 RepID=A0A0G3H3J9_9CORY|nr:DUF3017 domain-containing protein [Corynebacterium testudinoris]AKK07979.1 putative DUF3017 family protein [Corynebacterium testudinoris]MBX8995602.1 DUF3017 domain-containing protein [Corynebacterium testudinoris]